MREVRLGLGGRTAIDKQSSQTASESVCRRMSMFLMKLDIRLWNAAVGAMTVWSFTSNRGRQDFDELFAALFGSAAFRRHTPETSAKMSHQ